jgi:hypothetical protein
VIPTWQTILDTENCPGTAVEEAPSTSEAFNPYHKWLGIRCREPAPDHYRLLGISIFEDDPEVIDNAADQRLAFLRSIRWRQPVERGVLCDQLLREIAQAKACLANLAEKEEYDRVLDETIGLERLLGEGNRDRSADFSSETSLPSVESSMAQVCRLRRQTEAKETFRAVAYTAILFAVAGWGLILFCPWSLF